MGARAARHRLCSALLFALACAAAVPPAAARALAPSPAKLKFQQIQEDLRQVLLAAARTAAAKVPPTKQDVEVFESAVTAAATQALAAAEAAPSASDEDRKSWGREILATAMSLLLGRDQVAALTPADIAKWHKRIAEAVAYLENAPAARSSALRITGAWAEEVMAAVERYTAWLLQGGAGTVGAERLKAQLDAADRRAGVAMNSDLAIPAVYRKGRLHVLARTTAALLQAATRSQPQWAAWGSAVGATAPPAGVLVAVWQQIRRVNEEITAVELVAVTRMMVENAQDAVTAAKVAQLKAQVEHAYSQAGASVASIKGLDPSARRAVLGAVDSRRKGSLQLIDDLWAMTS